MVGSNLRSVLNIGGVGVAGIMLSFSLDLCNAWNITWSTLISSLSNTRITAGCVILVLEGSFLRIVLEGI